MTGRLRVSEADGCEPDKRATYRQMIAAGVWGNVYRWLRTRPSGRVREPCQRWFEIALQVVGKIAHAILACLCGGFRGPP